MSNITPEQAWTKVAATNRYPEVSKKMYGFDLQGTTMMVFGVAAVILKAIVVGFAVKGSLDCYTLNVLNLSSWGLFVLGAIVALAIGYRYRNDIQDILSDDDFSLLRRTMGEEAFATEMAVRMSQASHSSSLPAHS